MPPKNNKPAADLWGVKLVVSFRMKFDGDWSGVKRGMIAKRFPRAPTAQDRKAMVQEYMEHLLEQYEGPEDVEYMETEVIRTMRLDRMGTTSLAKSRQTRAQGNYLNLDGHPDQWWCKYEGT